MNQFIRSTVVVSLFFSSWGLAQSPSKSLNESNKLKDVLAQNAAPELMQEHGAGEGPAWHPQLGLFTSGDGHIMLRSKEGQVTIYMRDVGSNGLAFDRQGRLVICQPKFRRVIRRELDDSLTVLTERFEGRRYNQPNDLAIDAKDRIYFSDPRYGDRADMEMFDDAGRPIEGVYRIDPDGSVTRVISTEVERANGLAISPDGLHLFVADNNNNTVSGARKLWRFALTSDGGVQPGSHVLVHDWRETRGPDGVKFDQAGRLFVAAGLNGRNPPFEMQDFPTAGIYIFSPQGAFMGFVPIPRDECTNCAFGDDDLKSLYVTAGGTLWRIRMHEPGRR